VVSLASMKLPSAYIRNSRMAARPSAGLAHQKRRILIRRPIPPGRAITLARSPAPHRTTNSPIYISGTSSAPSHMWPGHLLLRRADAVRPITGLRTKPDCRSLSSTNTRIGPARSTPSFESWRKSSSRISAANPSEHHAALQQHRQRNKSGRLRTIESSVLKGFGVCALFQDPSVAGISPARWRSRSAPLLLA